ncbi:hypothetical protein JB92DRAFT_2942817, partial [Gautieria morchelliformis]
MFTIVRPTTLRGDRMNLFVFEAGGSFVKLAKLHCGTRTRTSASILSSIGQQQFDHIRRQPHSFRSHLCHRTTAVLTAIQARGPGTALVE